MIKDEKVEKIFRELQKKELIDRKRKLKVAKCENLQAAKLKNSIRYNPEFTKHLSENSIRFALLHEEGHKREKQVCIPLVISFFSIALISSILISTSSAEQNLKWGVLIIIWLIVALFPNIFKKKLELDEYRADEYASKSLYREYKLSPSKIFKKFTKEAYGYSDKKGGYSELFSYAIFGYHPFNFERLTRIKIIEEEMKDDD